MSQEENSIVEALQNDAAEFVPQKEFLTSDDKHVLDMVKMRKALAEEKLNTATAQNETAAAQYNNLVLQLTIKYTLTEKDIIKENGEIVRNATPEDMK